MPASITELFIIFFFATFFVAIIAFSTYGYMLVWLLKNHSQKFNPKGVLQFLKFLWRLLIYYISRSLAGLFGYAQLTELSFYMAKDRSIRAAELEHGNLRKAFTLFSSAYILFFVFLIVTGILLLYLLVDLFL